VAFHEEEGKFSQLRRCLNYCGDVRELSKIYLEKVGGRN
jgi:hypothetical protein